MARHVESLHCLPGVEYETATQTLYIDLVAYYKTVHHCVDDQYEEPCLFALMKQWKRMMPAHHVRQYVVKGVGL
jgi:hypothetical protein